MKICKLKLKNLNSFRKEIELDFEDSPLEGAGLVAITGPTGAGKTTLLDAICAALYGKTPRLDGAKNKSPYHLISHGESEGFAEIVFEANRRRYHATWTAKRRTSPKKITFSSTAQLLDEKGETIATTPKGVAEKVKSILGLDFKAFRRSVMLAQGEFAAFLKAPPEERRKILEAAADIVIYDMLKKRLDQEVKAAKEEYNEVANRIEGILETSPEEITEAEAVLDELKAEAADLTSKIQRLQQDREREAKRTEDYEKLCDSRERQAELAAQQPDLESLETETADNPDQLDPQNRISRATGLLERLNGQEKELTTTIAGQTECHQKVIALESEIAELSESHKTLLTKKEQAAVALKEASTELNDRRSNGTREKWNTIKQRALDAQPLARNLEKAADTLQKSEGDLQSLQEVLMQSNADLEELVSKFAAPTQRCQQAAAALQMCEAAQHAALIQDSANHLRQHLQAGEPCSVCGATEHPSAGIVDSESKARIQDAEKALEKAKAEIEAAQKSLQDLEMKQARIQNRRNDTADAIDECMKEIQTLQEQYTALYTEWNACYPDADVDSASDFLSKQIGRADTAMDALTAAEQTRDRASYHYETLARKLETSEADIDRQTAARTEAQDQEQTLNETLEALKSDVASTKERFWQLIPHSLHGSTPREALTQFGERIEAVRKYREERNSLELEIAKLNARFEENPFDPDALEHIEVQVEETEDARGDRQRQIGAQQLSIETLKDALQKRQALAEKLCIAEKEKARWERLDEIIPDNKLRDFALEITFKQMGGLANYQLRTLTSGRYQLKVEAIGELSVIDRWNANEERPVQTLSGGESFLISLALALALSELIRGRAQLHSLFLDEGFGTLDAETLDVAISALEGLHMQGRSIFVISHVQELTRRLPVKIKVTKTGDGASTARPEG